MIGVIIKYSDFYDTAAPKNPLNLILGLPKGEVIATIAAVNSRLKPIYSSVFDDSRETQIECIRAIFLDLDNPITHGISTPIIKRFISFPKNYTLFTRVTCLYAYQEFINDNNFIQATPKKYTPKQRENIFKFLLIANENLLLFENANKQSDIDKLKDNTFEFLMLKNLPHNQYYVASNPMNAFYKSWFLMDTLINDNFFSSHFKNFLIANYGLDDLTEFYKHIVGQYFQSNDDNLKINYLRITYKYQKVINILSHLSNRNNIVKPPRTSLKIFDFLELKKSPIYWEGTYNYVAKTTTFIVLDNIFFIEKMYSSFINDFWFDYLKPNNICNRKDWGNFIGSKFYEPLIDGIFQSSFKHNKRVCYKSTDDLKIMVTGKNSIEVADFYIRDRNEIILAEAKSNYLPVVNGYKEVNTIADYKLIDMNKFYKDFGLTQLVTKTIKLFQEYKPLLNDKGLQQKGKVKIYPLLIVNDPIISSGFSFFAFRLKFIKMLKVEKILLETKEHRIMPLSIVSTSELQEFEQSLKDRDQTIFNFFKMHFTLTNQNKTSNNYDVLMTFSHIINRWVLGKKLISKRVRRFHWLGFNK